MSLSDAKQKFFEIRKDISEGYFSSEHSKNIKRMTDLLKEYPSLCRDALDMIKEDSYDIRTDDKKDLLKSILEIEPKLSINIIRRMDEFNINDDYDGYKASIVTDVLRKQPDLADNIIKCVKDWDVYDQFAVFHEIVKNHPELFSKVEKVTFEKTFLINTFIDTKEKLSKKDVDMIMGEFSYKKFLKLYSEDMAEGLKFIEKFSKGNPENIEIQKKCLLLLENYHSDEKAKSITNEILNLQPKLREFTAQLSVLNTISASSKTEQQDTSNLFEYTTDSANLTQLWNRIVVKSDKKGIISSYIKQREKEQKLLNSQDISKFLSEINFKDDTSSVVTNNISAIVEQTKNAEVLKVLSHKKEEAYGVWDYKDIRKLEDSFAKKNYIVDTLYPNFLSLEEQSPYVDRDEAEEEIIRQKKLAVAEKLIQVADDVINSKDEQKKKEFNEFILAEGEPRLAELDAWVMEYLHENCTENNLNKVNALRSFYGLKVELATGKEVEADERAAVRKVFDRTWSSYERGKNTETGEPYYSETDMEKARKEDADKVQANPYYENSVSSAYRKYFEEHNIYEIYHNHKNDEDKKYSMQDYFDSLIDKSSFKALRKHGLYNDMKIICETLESLQVEPQIAEQFNLKDLSDMVVNSHNTLEDRKVYTRDTEEYMFTKSPHTDELDGYWRDPYYWHQKDDDDDEYDDECDNDDYEYANENDETLAEEKQYDDEGFEIIPDTDSYSERDEEVAARDAWWEDLSNHNPKAIQQISEAFARHGRKDYAISGFWEAASYGTPGVGSRRDWRLLSATLHHAEAIQYGGNDDKKNFVGATRYYDSYGDTFDEDDLHIDYHKSFHRKDTPLDALYINSGKSADDKLAIVDKPNENAQKAFLITSFTDPHMHFYAGFRKKDQYTAPLYHMRNIEKENQERVDKTEKSLAYLTKFGNALVSISICIEQALKTEEKIKCSKDKVVKNIMPESNVFSTLKINKAQNYSLAFNMKDLKNTKDELIK